MQLLSVYCHFARCAAAAHPSWGHFGERPQALARFLTYTQGEAEKNVIHFARYEPVHILLDNDLNAFQSQLPSAPGVKAPAVTAGGLTEKKQQEQFHHNWHVSHWCWRSMPKFHSDDWMLIWI